MINTNTARCLLTAFIIAAAMLLLLEYEALEYIKAWIYAEFDIPGIALFSGF